MGYSASTAAFETLERVMKHNGDKSQNVWVDDEGNAYFYEIGREKADGSISATVRKFTTPERKMCIRVGSLRINAKGKVVRWPNMNSKMRAAV